jgi:hypothetical protein
VPSIANNLWEWITARILVLAGQFCNLQSSSASMLPGVDECFYEKVIKVKADQAKSFARAPPSRCSRSVMAVCALRLARTVLGGCG